MYYDVWALAKGRNSIIIFGIILAFIAGTFVSGTQAFGAAQSGWQKAVDELQDAIAAIGPHTVDTNAGTICSTEELLDGDGSCQTIPTDSGGTVTQVNTGAGLTGGPITTTGSISVANNGITNTMLANDAVGSSNVIANSLTAADLATDSVGGSEIVGTSKLIFGSCSVSVPSLNAGSLLIHTCAQAGVSVGDKVVANLSSGGTPCLVITLTAGISNAVEFFSLNACNVTISATTTTVNYIVFKL